MSRDGSVLSLQNEFGHTVSVPFFTVSGAHQALGALASGQSIDVSRCLSPSRLVSTQLEAGNPYCRVSTYTLAVNCSRFTRTPVAPVQYQSAYLMTDIERSPMTTEIQRCVRERY